MDIKPTRSLRSEIGSLTFDRQIEMLQLEINALEAHERRLSKLRQQLSNLQAQCHHDWRSPARRSEHHAGYTDPGDPPGTMGVDWRGPVHVPARQETWWERTCKKCDKTEKTTQTKPAGEVPVF